MITLTLLEKAQKTPLKQWCFEGSTVIRIGRAVDNHVILSDNLVSRYHLELKLVANARGDDWELVSQGTNGTFLNGSLVTKCIVADNSLLQLAQGGSVLKIQIQELSPLIIQPSESGDGEVSQKMTAELSSTGCTHEGNHPQ